MNAASHPALVREGVTWSYGHLLERAREWAERHRAAAPEPLVAEATLDAVAALHGRRALGQTTVLMHPRWTEAERDAAWAEVLGAMATPGGEPMTIVFTSGSSGRPKGVALSGDAFRAAAEGSAANLGWRQGDRWLLCLPFAHVGGLSILTRCFAARKTVVMSDGDVESVVRAVARERVTLLSLVPAQLVLLLRRTPAWQPPPYVRALLVGGAGCGRSVLEEAADREWPVLTTYGLTEACSQVTTQRPGTVNRGPLGSGFPLSHVEVRLVDGVIHVRGPSVFTRYITRDAGPSRDAAEWFKTGDLGEWGEGGCLHVLGRRDDLIITSGAKVMPAEVEDALRSCPGVADACVFGRADPVWGQRVWAAVVSQASLDEGLVQRALAERLAPYKRPRTLIQLAALPRTTTGKVDRARVLAACAAAEALGHKP